VIKLSLPRIVYRERFVDQCDKPQTIYRDDSLYIGWSRNANINQRFAMLLADIINGQK